MLASNAAAAALSLSKGSVAVYCTVPSWSSDDAMNTLFEQALPLWLVNIQTEISAGTVSSAHFAGKSKDGLFIVAAGNTAKMTHKNAAALLAKNNELLVKAISNGGTEPSVNPVNICQMIQIGGTFQ